MSANDHSLVSICIPVYNAERFIVETVQSALAQTYPHVEIVIQDNASTDNTWVLLQALADQHAPIQIQQNPANFGPNMNFNRVVARARGSYINILGADDTLHPSFLEKCLQAFHEHSADVITTNYTLLKADQRYPRRINLRAGVPADLPSVILLQNPFMQPFTLFGRAVIQRFTQAGFFIAPNVVSSRINPTPTSAPIPIIFHSRLRPITPWARAEISVACGAGRGLGASTPTFAAPAKP